MLFNMLRERDVIRKWCFSALTLPCGSGSRMRHRPKWDRANFDAMYPPSPKPIRKGWREGGHATAKSGGGGSFLIPCVLCVCRVISRSVVKELSGDPLQFLPRMHGASAAEGGEGNEYLEKFMAITWV